MTEDATVKLAVLIDADNAQPSRVNYLLAEVAKYGTAFVKRAYGDWTGTSLRGWKEKLLECSIQPVQQFAYTQGKNATDSAMIIDAMDLLYSGRFGGFCLVSSDSDFTRLASRIRESGLVVYGCGERKTPRPFVSACDKFIYVENLVPSAELGASARPGQAMQPQPQPQPRRVVAEDPNLVAPLLREAIDATADVDGWANLAKVGALLNKLKSDFDARNYGFDKLGGLIGSLSMFETETRIPGAGKLPVMYGRVKMPPWRSSNSSSSTSRHTQEPRYGRLSPENSEVHMDM
ncbi:putative rhomboid protein [Purpureocillium lavendulum]|uniref:Rhomboid protein n=1 Tax=Purpureocillium lavendulum TaxID=1247861 RepID=A0AB34FHK8_9HYPO|nr:putative rhomboid protein [Purpureocillium lavendulum]